MGFTFTDDIIDTRAILERIEEIESDNTDDEGEVHGLGAWPESDRKEWHGLTEIIEAVGEEASREGTALIRESYFVQYIEDEWLEIGDELYEMKSRSGSATWDMEPVLIERGELLMRSPFCFIDWKRVADDVWSGYLQLVIDGTTYLYEGR
jgi:hypothetical protein